MTTAARAALVVQRVLALNAGVDIYELVVNFNQPEAKNPTY